MEQYFSSNFILGYFLDLNGTSEIHWKILLNLQSVEGNEARRSHLSRHVVLLTIKYIFLHFTKLVIYFGLRNKLVQIFNQNTIDISNLVLYIIRIISFS